MTPLWALVMVAIGAVIFMEFNRRNVQESIDKDRRRNTEAKLAKAKAVQDAVEAGHVRRTRDGDWRCKSCGIEYEELADAVQCYRDDEGLDDLDVDA